MASTATLLLPDIITAFEKRWRGDHANEHGLLLDRNGELIVERTGDYDSVEFEPAELSRAIGGFLTHTHPRGLPPSGNDLAVAATYGLTLRAAGIAPDTGDQFDHTVKMAVPSEAFGQQLFSAFGDYCAQAEQELAHKPMGDLQWQRDARHLALKRLSQMYGFFYERVQRNLPLSEAKHHEKARLDVLTNVETVMQQQVFTPLHNEIIRSLSRLADQNGIIPIARIEQARQVVSSITQRTILGSPTRDGSLHPYTVQGGEVIPRSLYFKVLWGLMRESGQTAINRQADLMRKYLPADLIRQLEYATVSPFEESVSEIKAPDLSGRDPLHLWTGPDGKHLLDRIWNVAGDMYHRLDDFLSSAIARRLKMSSIDRQLEKFLITDKGNYEAMRLARTEVAATYSRSDSAAAAMNPLVETYQPFVSPQHNHVDVCDDQVRGGPYLKSDLSHLPPYHPFCLCGVFWNLVEDIPAVIVKLQSAIARAIAAGKKAFSDVIGPLSRRFLDLLFGARR